MAIKKQELLFFLFPCDMKPMFDYMIAYALEQRLCCLLCGMNIFVVKGLERK